MTKNSEIKSKIITALDKEDLELEKDLESLDNDLMNIYNKVKSKLSSKKEEEVEKIISENKTRTYNSKL